MEGQQDSQANLHQNLGGISRDVKAERGRALRTEHAGNFYFSYITTFPDGQKVRNWSLGRKCHHKAIELSIRIYGKNCAKS